MPIDLAKNQKPFPAPKKYTTFSSRDSWSIEIAFQKLVDEERDATQRSSSGGDIGEDGIQKKPPNARQKLDSGDLGDVSRPQTSSQGNTSINESTGTEKGGIVKVPVNEDFLFDVDIEARELAPAYWLGPIYDVRRGSWFYQEGSSLRPCDENLAVQLEEGYLKVKPWRSQPTQPASQPKSSPVSMNVEDASTPTDKAKDDTSIPAKFELQTQRLFGAYMNHVVTYQDAGTAWLLTDDFLSRMSSTVYQRFAGGGYLGGTKVIRGYSEASKAKDAKKETDQTPDTKKADGSIDKSNRRSAPPKTDGEILNEGKPSESDATSPQEPRLLALERQLSSFAEDPALQEEERRQADENEIKEDYKDEDGQDQGREIEHLILVTHGIGQRLGLRLESINFIHDVNVLRKTLKSVYETSPDLQALNSELDKLPKNCRLQVLPVVWRHLLDFPKQSFQQNQKEQDLTDPDTYGDDDEYPSLENITVEGVPAIRNLITDLALDILLYQSAYREHIASIVQQECNRVYELFVQRNPTFSGKVSLIGHSLGSAILFDILSRQKETKPTPSGSNRYRKGSQRGGSYGGNQPVPDLGLKFEVEDFYCLGSPLGLYQMLKGRKIAARRSISGAAAQSPLNPDALDDSFLGASSQQLADIGGTRESDILSVTVSSPKCEQLYNIFHPADPIAYRIEPLISRAMSSLKPQPLPYTKKGIFGVQAQGFTNIGARVGQSVSGLWSNITSGVASSLLNRSLGLTGEGQLTSSQSMNAPQIQQKPNTSTLAGNSQSEQEQNPEYPPTLIDSELETLYAGFEKRRKSHQSDENRDLGESAQWMEADEKSKRLRREEAKVRALNSNGRVDFSVQE